MTHKLRKFLLNEQISIEARRIAHAATATCRYGDGDIIEQDDDCHTCKCNALKKEIEALALQVKLAASQRPAPRPLPPLVAEPERAGAT